MIPGPFRTFAAALAGLFLIAQRLACPAVPQPGSASYAAGPDERVVFRHYL